MNNFLRFLINRRLSANILSFCVLGLGIWAVLTLPLAEKPLVELGKGTITTSYPGASAQDIEVNINSKLEKELLSVPGIKTFKSSAEMGRSSIEIELKPNVRDIKGVYQDIRDAINRVSDLPPGVTDDPVLTVKKSSNLDFMVVGISSSLRPYYELRKKAKLMELGLRRIEGVGEVHLQDMRDLEHIIKVEPEQIRRYGLTLTQVSDAVAKTSILSTGGSLKGIGSQADVIVSEELKTPELLGDVILSKNPKIKLSDVTGEIKAGTMKTTAYSSLNGEQSIGFDLRTSDGADVIKTAERVKAFLASEQDNLGSEYKLHIGFDLSEEIAQKFSIIKNNGIVGLVLVVLSLVFLLNKRIALPVAMSMPFCMFGAIAVLPLLGQILDSYTMAAILLIMGVIVDDAVVVSEKISSRYRSGEKLMDAALNGLRQVIPSVSISILTTMVAFLPLLAIPGNTGKMLYVMPLVVVLALLFSFIDVVFILPSHVIHGLKNDTAKGKAQGDVFWIKWLESFLLILLNHRIKVVISFILAASYIGYLSFQNLPYIFFPSSGAYLVEVAVEVNGEANLETAWKNTRAVESVFEKNTEVKRWYGEVGLPYSTWTLTLTPVASRDLSAEEIVAEMEKEIKGLDGIIDVEFDIDTGGAPVGKPIEVEVAGGEDENRERLIADLTQWLEQQNGVIRVHKASPEIKPQIVTNINHSLLREYGIDVSHISRTLKIAIDGERAGRVFYDGEEIFLRVMVGDAHKDLKKLLTIPILTPDGEFIKLDHFITWERRNVPSAIKHYNGQRSTKVTAGVVFGVTDPIRVEAAMRNYFKNKDYGGARLITTGQAKSSKEALNGLTIALVVAVGGIFCLLLLLFDNICESLTALSIIPFGIAASVFSLWIHNESLSFFAIVGAIGLVGIMVNNSLVLISYYKQNAPPLSPVKISTDEIKKFAVSGATNRARAVIITSITTILGMIPLAYGFGGYDNFMGPIALVIGWGVFINAICVLVFIPSLYSLVYQWQHRLSVER